MTQYAHIGGGPPAPPRKTGLGTGAVIGIAGAALAVGLGIGCLGGIAIGGSADGEKTTAGPTAANNQPAAVVTTQPATKAPETKPPAGPATTIEDGTWTVGLDIAAGTYRPRDPAPSDCYWKISKSGTNGADIIQNDIGGGRPTVSLKVGQDFTTNRCGTWVKQ